MLDELIYDTLPPEAISDELRPTIEALGLERNCRELAEEGWTVVEDVAPAELIERLHDAVLAASTVQGGQGGGSVCLTKDSVFAEAATNPKVCAMAEFSVGRGFLLSQISCSVHGEGPGFVGLKIKGNWLTHLEGEVPPLVFVVGEPLGLHGPYEDSPVLGDFSGCVGGMRSFFEAVVRSTHVELVTAVAIHHSEVNGHPLIVPRSPRDVAVVQQVRPAHPLRPLHHRKRRTNRPESVPHLQSKPD